MTEERGKVLKREKKRCRGCGSFVTGRFRRVFGDNDNRVYGCHECSSMSELIDGGAVNEA